jgi:dihydrofolate reductase
LRTAGAQPAGELQVHGSGALTRWLFENDLLDEMNLLIVPWSSARARGCSPTAAPTWRLTWSNREPSRRA